MSDSRKNWLGVAILFVLINVTLFPFAWGPSTLQDSSAQVPSLYQLGSVAAPEFRGEPLRVLDPGAPGWFFEPITALEHNIVWNEHAFPLWNSDSMFGAPLAANMQSQPLSPFAWPAIVQPSPRAWNWMVLLRLFAAGALAFLYLRLFVGFVPAMFGGISMMYAGYFWLYLTMPQLSVEVIGPGLLYAAERLVRLPNFNRSVVLAAFCAASIFGGMPEATFLALTFSASYTAVRLLADPALRSNWRRGFAFGSLGFALGICLASVVVFPFLEYVPNSWNGHSAVGVMPGLDHDGFSFGVLAQYISPLLYGPPESNIFLSYAGWTGIRGFFGSCAAFLALANAIAAIHDMARRRTQPGDVPTAFFGLALFLLVAKRFAFGPVNWIGYLPVFRSVGMQKYDEALIAACVAILAAFGLSRAMRGRLPQAAAWLSFGSIVVCATCASAQLKPSFLAIDGHRSIYLGALLLTLSVAGIAMAGSFALARGRIGHSTFGIGMLALLAFELHAGFIVPMYYVLTHRAPQSSSALNGAPYVSYLSAHLKFNRIYGQDDVLFPQWSDAFGFQDVRAVDALYPKRYLDFVTAFIADPGDHNATTRIIGWHDYDFSDPLERRFLALSSVKYFLASQPVGVSGSRSKLNPLRQTGFSVVYRDKSVAIERFDGALPRVAIFRDVRPSDGEETSLALMTQPAFDPLRSVVVEGLPRAAYTAKTDAAASAGDIVSYASQRVVTTIDSATPAVAMLNDTNYPGWHADVDGREVPIYAADVLFRGVVVPAGRHRLTFTYAPRSFLIGLCVSLVTVLFIACAYAGRTFRKFPRPN